MSDIKRNLERLRSKIPSGVKLVAVSKFQPVEALREAYDAGQRVFGESRVQELLGKIPLLPTDVRWHFIGHLQTNKVRQLIGAVSLIESVDSMRLLSLIDEESRKKDVRTRVLLQVHVAREETKFGFSPEELISFFDNRQFESLSHVSICGLMAMATNTSDKEVIREDFSIVHSLFTGLKEKLCGQMPRHRALEEFNQISMGMSSDWQIAVEVGATIIRVGSAIFGERHY